MRTVPWKTVFERAVQLCGYSTDRITVSDREYFEAAIDQQAGWAWETEWWPELTPIEERYFRDAFDVTQLYAASDETWWEDAEGTESYYMRLAAGSGDLPSDTDTWEKLTEINAYVELEQTGETEIGEVRAVYKHNPRTATNPYPLNWELGPMGIQIVETSPVSVFVEFRKKRPSWSGLDYALTETLAIGDVRYSSGEGDFFEALTAESAQSVTDATKFTRVEFPRIFETFVTRMVFGDWLGNSGNAEKGTRQEKLANKFLEREQHKITGQQRQVTRSRVMSRGSRSKPRRLT